MLRRTEPEVSVRRSSLSRRLLLALAFTVSCSRWELGEAQPRGDALLVPHADGDRLLLLVQREERDVHKPRNAGPGRRQHFELHAIDAATLLPLWSRRVASKQSEFDGNTGERLVALDGERVWAFVGGSLVLAAADGSLVADAAKLAAENPALAGRLPDEPRDLAWKDGLVLTATDGSQHRIAPGAWRAEAWSPPETPRPRDELEYQEMQAQSSLSMRVDGLRSFQIAGGGFGDRWLGVLDAFEAKSFAFHGATPVQRRDDGARRTFHRATRAGRRWIQPTPIGSGQLWTHAGLLREAGAFEPIRLAEPDGALLLHRRDGVLHLVRADLEARVLYDVPLPLAEIEQVLAGSVALTMIGRAAPPPDGGDAKRLAVAFSIADASIVSLDLATLPPAAAPDDAHP
jgi:hypothetical protein